ncbi:DUF4153 domain-containing protein, partial [Candidatus Gracilibacteria bacterium]|nr:DUF4153 domain-containing protein [Candidatus Gracilibacteria bacterium]
MKKIKNFFQKKFFLDVKNNLKKSFKNFPISFISIILIFGILEFLVLKGNFLSENLQNILGKLILSLSIVAILGVGIKFFLEDKMGICLGKSCKIKKKIIGFSPIIFGILFFVNFEGSLLKNFYFEDFLYIFISIFLAVCFLFVSKFLKIKKIENGKMLDGEYKNSEYIHFLNGQIGKIGISFLAGFILMILGFIAFSAIFSLFDLGDFLNTSKVFGFWLVFSFGFFAPIYFLVKNSEKKSENSQNIFFEFLTKFLFLPSIFIYFIILFAYSAKILLNFQNWPNGVISWLIIFFSTFGYLVYAEIFQLSAKNNFAKIFKKFFPFAVLLQMPMFFYAIFLRINQYDWTINRYLLVGLGLYFTVISLYFIISKNKKLVNIFWILFLFLSFISFSGPFSVYKFPENQQLKILEKNLIEAKILQNGKIILSKEDV